MTDNDNDFTLNDPSQFATGKALNDKDSELLCVATDVSVESGHREGEIEITVPEPTNVESRPLSETERQHYSKIDTEAEQKRLAILASQVSSESRLFNFSDGFRKVYMYGLVGVAAVLSLLILGQVTTTLAQLKTLPVWSQWVIGTLLLLVVAVILYLVAKIMCLFFGLRKNEQINITSIKALEEREVLRSLSKEKSSEAVTKLKSYLEEFPIDDDAKFLGLGFTHSEHAKLVSAHKELLSHRPAHETPNQWLDQFQKKFQSVLNDVAVRRTKGYATKTALKTAISPLPLLDMTIAMALSLAMVRDMMVLYNLRMGYFGAGQVLVRAIGQAYLAGQIQDFSETLADALGDMIAEQAGQVVGSVAKVVSSKVGEGIANGLMIYRLGKATSKLLQPSS